MFQFNEHDLDFGIYRITRLKRQFIENFIDGEGVDSLRAIGVATSLKHIGISPDKLNAGEKKFLADILQFIDVNYSRDHREFYLMRNVESLRSIGLYLEGETRAFYPDFVLWIEVDSYRIYRQHTPSTSIVGCIS
jgi:hypothetical protein